jgi:hypothetical protein
MPAVQLGSDEQAIQDSAFHIGAAMGEERADVSGGNG